MIDKKTKTRVSNLMRRDLKKTFQYNEAKKRAFKGKTVYHCVECDKYYYTGASDKNFEKLKEEEYPDLVKVKSSFMEVDHKNPVVPYDREMSNMTLDELAVNIYCEAENLNCICKSCHAEKSKVEASIRAKYRELEKLEK